MVEYGYKNVEGIILEERRYKLTVNVCVHGLRMTMLILAVMIPVVITVHPSILTKLAGVQTRTIQMKYLYDFIYSEVILGYLLCMFLNFREKEIFILENTKYLRIIGKLVIAKDFIYIPLDLFINQSVTIPFNVTAWLIGGILVLFSRLLQHGIEMQEAQKYTI